MQVRDVMNPGARSVPADESLTNVAALMRAADVGAVPVLDNGRLVGIVTDRDIVLRGLTGGADPLLLKARDVMTADVSYCYDDEDLDDAVHIMEEEQIRRLPVIDARSRIVGMLTLGDLAMKAPPSLARHTLIAICSGDSPSRTPAAAADPLRHSGEPALS